MNRRPDLGLLLAVVVAGMALLAGDNATAGEKPAAAHPKRRILYNLDGDSCMFRKKGSQGPVAINVADLRTIVHEITEPGSQVDTLLVCINAQVMYYPTKAGTMRGTDCTPEERKKWPASEEQRFRNVQALFDAGTDPYAVLLAEAKKRGREALLTFRMNDAHGNDFLRTAFWRQHPEYRLGAGALDFKHAAVRDYVFGLIQEAVDRYDCDGIELDFQRFPTFFKDGTTEERVARINRLVERVRQMLDAQGRKRGRRLVLAVRVPSEYGRTPPSYEKSLAIGCDPVAWAKNGSVDFVTVSEFLFVRYDLPIKPWIKLLPNVPVYGGIECTEGSKREQYLTPEKYRRAARHLWSEGADGIYLFNFFTSREWNKEASEPPFEVLRELGDPSSLTTPGPVLVNDTIAVANRKTLPVDRIACERIVLGEPDDYKPCLAQLPDGDLLLTAFHQHRREGGKVMEQNLLFRSPDGGRTWTGPEKLDLLGREPYLTVLSDGTLFMTGHLLANDVRNPHGYTHGYLHRSTDRGKTWQTTRIESENIKPKASNHSTRNVLEMPDRTLLLGVDYDGGGGPYLMWRSPDRGKTWEKEARCKPIGFQSKYGFFGGETWLWRARSGKILALVRVDSNEIPILNRPVRATDDQDDHFVLYESKDAGQTFRRVDDLGDYGEMYMSLLRLRDRRLLLTFTVRKRNPPLGVRALLGTETDDGFRFDFGHDRLMLDVKTGDREQGGGFGTTVQLRDGTLVTCCSYRGPDKKTHLEVIRWQVPAAR